MTGIEGPGLLTVLAVDDDRNFCRTLAENLSGRFDVLVATNAREALGHLFDQKIDVILLDMRMPEMSGMELLRIFRQRFEQIPVLMLTANTDSRSIIEAMRAGATDYLTKSGADLCDELSVRIPQALERSQLLQQNRTLVSKVRSHAESIKMVGDSTPMMKLALDIQALKGKLASVLITGESGVGKEVVAQVLHNQEEDPGRPMVSVNCAAIPKELIESELFGHEKGAFTGAISKNPGKFLAANDGDIFLDEIGELPIQLQAKLLRAIQEKEVTPVGGTRPVKVNVRIIAATNRDLADEVRTGRFREDLYYRISVIRLHVPPLRDRAEDIPALVEHFLTQLGASHYRLSREAMSAVRRHRWPGNVRALRNCLERAWILTSGNGRSVIEDDSLHFDDAATGRPNTVVVPHELLARSPAELSPELHREYMAWAERVFLEAALDAVQQNKTRLAGLLGVSRNCIHEKVRSLGIGAGDRQAEVTQ